MEEGSCSYSTETTRQTITTQLNDSLYELHKPRGQPSAQVIFFHGFQLREGSDPHLSTWRSGDDSTVWPQTWLVDEFPDAHILTVAYNAELLRDSKGGKIDMYIIGENILSDLLQEKIGRNPRCPVVLVGHSFGGLVMKELCCQAHNTRTSEHEIFLNAIKGLFFYSTPHYGIRNVGVIARFLSDSPLLEYVETLNKSTARMNNNFAKLVKKYGWQISGVGENLPIKLNPFPAFLVVPEASARCGDFYLMPGVDHITVCKPIKKSSASFNKLKGLLHALSANSMKMVRPGNFQHLPQKFIGMEDTLDTLKIKLRESRSLGLAGMGGIGKSTLARALFNELEFQFEYTCFISEVKNVTKSSNPAKDLMGAILLNLHHWGKQMGDEKENNLWFLKGKLLLLILDDVASEEKDLEIVAMLQNTIGTHKDSRVVATSRDGELLKRCLDDLYIVDLLNDETSRKLFVFHAFSEGVLHSVEGYIDDIVKKCGKLPLALEVTGKHLKGKDESIWLEARKALEESRTIHGLQEQLMSILRLSYDGLLEVEKQMFLDSGTVLYGDELDVGKMVWSVSTKESQDTHWLRLLNLSLVWEVKSKDGLCIGMHEQLRTLASQIASTPGAHAERIWGNFRRAWEVVMVSHGSSSYDLKNIAAFDLDLWTFNPEEEGLALEQGTTSFFHFLKGLMKHGFSFSPRQCICRTTICKMGNLRYLRLDCVDLDGNPCEELPSTLVVLVWRHAEFTKLPFNPTSHKQMTVLELEASELRNLPSKFGQLSGLQVLRITCPLKSLPDSFGDLLCLRELTLKDCRFQKLPETFGRLQNLKKLTFEDTLELKALPQSFGDLSQLQLVKFGCCPELEVLPNSFKGLRNLKQLELIAHKMKALPQSIWGLSELESLKFCLPQLETLPDSLGGLPKLRELRISCPGKLRTGGDPSGSFALEIFARRVSTFPEFSESRATLERLRLGDVDSLSALPDSLGRLPMLKKLEITFCPSLEKLPDTLGNLAELAQLKISGCRALSTLPDSCGHLAKLEELTLDVCDSLSTLPDSLGQLKMLMKLEIEACPALEKLPDTLGELAALVQLKISCCRALSTLPDSCGELAMLEELTLDGCGSLSTLPNSLGELRMLKELKITSCSALEKLPDTLGDLAQLSALEISGCRALSTLPDTCGGLRKLESLSLWRCHSLSALPDSLGRLQLLKDVVIEDCPALEEVPETIRSLISKRKYPRLFVV